MSIIEDLTDLLAAGIDTIATDLKVYSFDPGTAGLDSLPAAIVGLPDVSLDAAGTQIGYRDWQFTYDVQFFFDLGDPIYAQQQAAQAAEEYVAMIGAAYLQQNDPQIDPDGVQISDISWSEVADQARPMLTYTARTTVLKLIP